MFSSHVYCIPKYITIGAEGLGFDSLAGQIGHSVANSSRRCIFILPSCVVQVLSRDESRHSLRRNTASILKIFYVDNRAATFVIKMYKNNNRRKQNSAVKDITK